MKKFGHAPIEESPWRECEPGRAKACATFDSPDFSIDDKSFDDGDSLVNEWPKDVKLQMEPPKKDNKIYDVMRVKYDEAVVSEKVAAILREDPNIELLPVTLYCTTSRGSWYLAAASLLLVVMRGTTWAPARFLVHWDLPRRPPSLKHRCSAAPC